MLDPNLFRIPGPKASKGTTLTGKPGTFIAAEDGTRYFLRKNGELRRTSPKHYVGRAGNNKASRRRGSKERERLHA